MKAVTVRVSGKVQGVFFRASTKDKADELQVKGFVRNEADGSVYIEAEADEHILDQFLHWCKHGPNAARVDRCEIKDSTINDFKDFSIKR